MNELPYKSGSAMWTALKDRAKAASKENNILPAELMRRLVYDRLLARVFANPSESWVVTQDPQATPADPWVLKGGTAVLARVNDARHSKDIDLLHRSQDIEEALTALETACDMDLEDHFRFVIKSSVKSTKNTHQPNTESYKVTIEAYCGTTRREVFHVDLVTGSQMTAPPEVRVAGTPLDIPGLQRPTLRLYPVVDHVADKLCATETMYGEAPSSRARDLVDLVVFARTQSVSGAALHIAIKAERTNRDLPHANKLVLPPEWERTYPPLAKKPPQCADYQDLSAAHSLVAKFLEPAMSGDVDTETWNFETNIWE